MIAQSVDQRKPATIIGRLAAAVRSLSERIDSLAYRSQLGPTRPNEAADFRPARRR